MYVYDKVDIVQQQGIPPTKQPTTPQHTIHHPSNQFVKKTLLDFITESSGFCLKNSKNKPTCNLPQWKPDWGQQLILESLDNNNAISYNNYSNRNSWRTTTKQ